MRIRTRRSFLASASGAILLACTGAKVTSSPLADDPTNAPGTSARVNTAVASPTAVPPSPTPRPAGAKTRELLAGTEVATMASIRHSGVPGPTAIVLGGVHGNEPGGWMAADVVATWEPSSGSLIVVPRANVIAIDSFVRTTDAIGDLNRLYPGDDASGFLMERMAAAVLDLAREFGASLLLDMHESWGFYAEYPEGTGTVALGQTLTAGVGPLQNTLAAAIAQAVNPSLPTRDQFIVRDGTRFSRPSGTVTPGQPARGRSSLSAGGHVEGLTPLLVELGQEGQPLDRRVDLHLAVARSALTTVRVI